MKVKEKHLYHIETNGRQWTRFKMQHQQQLVQRQSIIYQYEKVITDQGETSTLDANGIGSRSANDRILRQDRIIHA